MNHTVYPVVGVGIWRSLFLNAKVVGALAFPIVLLIALSIHRGSRFLPHVFFGGAEEIWPKTILRHLTTSIEKIWQLFLLRL